MAFDATSFTVFGILPYIFFSGVGAVAFIICYNLLLLKSVQNIRFANKTVVLSIPFLFIGAKAFGMISNIIECLYYNKPITINALLRSGIVYYGGLLFFLLGVHILLRKCDNQTEQSLIQDAIAVSIPAFHFFGRIGCFTAGCCYGIESRSMLSVNYTTFVHGTVLTQQRIPIQLIESFINLIIFIILLWLFIHKKKTGKLLLVYLIIYPVARFFDEFLRDDVDKTILHGFSAAQLLSVNILIIVFFVFFFDRRKKRYEFR